MATTAQPQPKSMTRAKKWDEQVETAYRFQTAGYRDEAEYNSINGEKGLDRWEHNGYIKKLQRKDGCFYYFNRKRECLDKDVNKCKLYVY